MGMFGWSYPPGCSSVPGDEAEICEVCATVDDCICPECPVCESLGDPKCYLPTEQGGHGMVLNEEQKASVKKMEEWTKQENERYEYLGTHIDEEL